MVEKERGVWNLDKSVTPHDGLDVSQPKERSSGISNACSGAGRPYKQRRLWGRQMNYKTCLALPKGLSIPLEPGIPKIYGLPPRSYITKIQNIGERDGGREREIAHEHFLLSRGPISITGAAQHVAC